MQDGKNNQDTDNDKYNDTDKYNDNDKYDDNNNDNDNDNNNDSDNEPSDCVEQHCEGRRNSTVKVQDEALVRAKALNETSLKSLQYGSRYRRNRCKQCDNSSVVCCFPRIYLMIEALIRHITSFLGLGARISGARRATNAKGFCGTARCIDIDL